MDYHVEVKRDAEKALKKLPQHVEGRIRKVLVGLAKNPRPVQCKRLHSSEHYRIRIGDYRIVYLIDDRIRNVFVTDVGHRGEIYR